MKIKNKVVEFRDLGLIDYQVAWNEQIKLFQTITSIKLQNREKEEGEPTPNYLIFCQHPHVYTLGKSGNQENLLLKESELAKYQASFYRIDRGGDITYHGPGQLVGYPILDLENFFMDIHQYLRLLEDSIIQTCRYFGLEAGRIPGLTGVWLDDNQKSNPRKICAIGVRTSRWVTMHGFAFNINTNLSYFNHIVPCGISDKAVTSLAAETGHRMDESSVMEILLKNLTKVFGMKIKKE